MKAKSKKVLSLLLCGAFALGGVSCGIVTAIEARKHNEAKSDILEKYEYDLVNAKLKSEKILELAQKLEDKEISLETYQQETKNVKDISQYDFIQEYATEEDAKNYENASSGYITMSALAFTSIAVFDFAGFAAVDILAKGKKHDKEQIESAEMTI